MDPELAELAENASLIRAVQKRANAAVKDQDPEPLELTVVDIEIDGDETSYAKTLAKLKRACEEVGMFKIKGLGVNGAVTHHVVETAAQFFAKREMTTPEDDFKRRSTRKRSRRGYRMGETREVFAIGPSEDDAFEPNEPVPDCRVQDFEELMQTYYDVLHRVETRVWEMLCESLDLEESAFADVRNVHKGLLVLQHTFREKTDAELAASGGVREKHVYGAWDRSTLSILGFSRPDETHVRVLVDDEWRALSLGKKGEVVVSVGEILHRLTNGRFAAPVRMVHRKESEFNYIAYHGSAALSKRSDVVVAPRRTRSDEEILRFSSVSAKKLVTFEEY